MRRWKTKTRTKSGILEIMPAAMISPKGICIEYCDGKLAMITGSVRASGWIEVKVRANRYSFQAPMKASRPVVTSAGAVSGSMII